MSMVEGKSSFKRALHRLQAKAAHRMENFLDEFLVVCKEIAETYDPQIVPDASEKTAAVQPDRIATLPFRLDMLRFFLGEALL